LIGDEVKMHRISKRQLLLDVALVAALLAFVVGIKNYTVKPLEFKTMGHNSDQELELEEEFFWGVHMG